MIWRVIVSLAAQKMARGFVYYNPHTAPQNPVILASPGDSATFMLLLLLPTGPQSSWGNLESPGAVYYAVQ